MCAEPTRKKKATKIILDSNALFVPLQFKIDIFEGIQNLLETKAEFILLSPIKEELQQLAEKGGPKMRKNAAYALEQAKKCHLVKVDKAYKSLAPDDIILELSREWKCPVFTNDRQLRKKLRDINVPVIYVRQKSRLEIDGRV